jgi:hypothetical protein
MSRRAQPPPDPASWWEPPEGKKVVWVPDDDWRLASPEEQASRKCRRPGCQRPPVAAMLRRRVGRPAWWLYCDWHLYGRRIEAGQVLGRRAVRDEA